MTFVFNKKMTVAIECNHDPRNRAPGPLPTTQWRSGPANIPAGFARRADEVIE